MRRNNSFALQFKKKKKKTMLDGFIDIHPPRESFEYTYVDCGQSRINSRNHGIARHSGVCYAGSHVAMQMILNRLGRVFARNSDNQSMTLLSLFLSWRPDSTSVNRPTHSGGSSSIDDGETPRKECHFHSRVLVSLCISFIGLESKSKLHGEVAEFDRRRLLKIYVQLLDCIFGLILFWLMK